MGGKNSGRKPLPESQRRSEIVMVRLRPDEYQALIDRAREKRRRAATYVRDLILKDCPPKKK